MKDKLYIICLSVLLLNGCGAKQDVTVKASEGPYDFVVAFASCNDQDREQPLWKPIIAANPDVFIWGGDNIYADTADMQKMEADYNKVWAHSDYQKVAKTTEITGTWDDHDYGKNDAGVEWHKKEEAQQLFLDFLKVPAEDPRRNRAGVYTSKTYETPKGALKLILLDTRYFRSPLNKSNDPDRRYEPWPKGEGGTILGTAQWDWLENELEDNTADFTLIVSSIQFLADEHGWEKWGNHPMEVEKMYQLLQEAKASNILFLSGDRHHAEVSVNPKAGLDYPLVDFTTSGLTHTFPGDPMDSNRYRVGEGTKQLNYGLLYFNWETNQVRMEIRGENGTLLQEYTQSYKP